MPSKIKLPELTLLGVGVRTVSFLGIKVYSVGFYADLENPDLKVDVFLDNTQGAGNNQQFHSLLRTFLQSRK